MEPDNQKQSKPNTDENSSTSNTSNPSVDPQSKSGNSRGTKKRQRPKRPKSKMLYFWIILLLLSLGSFPVITALQHRDNVQYANHHAKTLDQMTKAEKKKEFAKVRAYDEKYNKEYEHGARGESLENDSQIKSLYGGDNGVGAVGTIDLPTIGVKNLVISKFATNSYLQTGAGVVPWGQYPADNKTSNTVILAHSGMALNVMFNEIGMLKYHDKVFIKTLDRILEYEVIDKEKMSPAKADTVVHPTKGKNLVTMITCTPIGLNWHREVVTAQRIKFNPNDYYTAKPNRASQNAEKLFLIIATVLSLLGVLWLLFIVANRIRTIMKERKFRKDMDEMEEQLDQSKQNQDKKE